MVFAGRRSWGSREEVPRRFRGCCSLERSFRGTSRVLANTRQCLVFELVTEIIGACVQVGCLWIADPKAISHILQKTGYLYAKPSSTREGSALVTDRGISWAEGELSVSHRGRFLLLARPTIPQETYTCVTGGQCLQHSGPSRLKVCYRVSWVLLPRYVEFVCTWS